MKSYRHISAGRMRNVGEAMGRKAQQGRLEKIPPTLGAKERGGTEIYVEGIKIIERQQEWSRSA